MEGRLPEPWIPPYQGAMVVIAAVVVVGFWGPSNIYLKQ